jgi:4-hydroxyphenylpyruvate dioxygenase-like putative hemolysin
VIRQKRIRKHFALDLTCAAYFCLCVLVFQYGDTVHTFVQRDGYKGIFLPGYKSVERVDPLSTLVASPQLQFIDHIVGNQPDLQMLDVCNWYENVLGFHRFWSVDDSQVRDRKQRAPDDTK